MEAILNVRFDKQLYRFPMVSHVLPEQNPNADAN